jgi:RNA polymerase sigma factor (sigma-70 family)
MVTEIDTATVVAARAGDQQALDRLVTEYLPLVYNIVGRALGGGADVDDVVQESMLRLVRGLSKLRNPASFRSWLVAVTMNQVRTHRQRRASQGFALDALDHVADPGADFADLTVTRLALSGQRREVVEATRWLEADARELLSLWWLEEAGHLTRADLVAAFQQDPHHVTVRLARTKSQLEAARRVVRALAITPRCAGLAEAASGWPGPPQALWRKRFARHVRECEHCLNAGADLVPPERLLADLALVPVPAALAAATAAAVRHSAPATAANRHGRSHRQLTRRRGRGGAGSNGVGLVTGIGVAVTAGVAVTVAVVLAAYPRSGDSESANSAAKAPITHTPATRAPATPTRPRLSPSTTPPLQVRSAITKRPARHSPKARSAHPPISAADATLQGKVLAYINQLRAAHGLPPYTLLAGLNTSAARHSRTMAGGCGMSHQCPGEPAFYDRESQAGVDSGWSSENIAWISWCGPDTSAITTCAINLTKSMYDEKPPDDGHRRALLSTDYHHIGISALRDSKGNIWLTQDFAG